MQLRFSQQSFSLGLLVASEQSADLSPVCAEAIRKIYSGMRSRGSEASASSTSAFLVGIWPIVHTGIIEAPTRCDRHLYRVADDVVEPCGVEMDVFLERRLGDLVEVLSGFLDAPPPLAGLFDRFPSAPPD